ncbi:MAG: hypothetical protein ACQGVK_13510 [Myxococcota bacterium]
MEREPDRHVEVGSGDGLARRLGTRPRATALALFVGCLVLYHANGRPITQIDTVAAPWAAFEVVLGGSVDLSGIRYLDRFEAALVHREDGGRVSRYPPGSTFVAVPFAAPFAWAYGEPLRPSRMRRFGKAVAALCCAAAIVLFAFTCREVAPGAALPATLVLAAGTTVWSVAGQALWTHGPALLWVSLGHFLQWVVEPRARQRGRGDAVALAAGLAYGLAVFTRPTTGLVALGSLAALFAVGARREAVLTALGLAGPVALLLLYDFVQFGSLGSGGYGAEAARFDTPVWTGVAGLLVAPSRGLLVYSPALVLAPLGWWVARRWPRACPAQARARALLLGWWGAALATCLLYAKWHAWAGGWCFGPRFLTETLPAWCLFFALAVDGRARWSTGRRRALAGLVALAVLVHALGVFGHGNDWNQRGSDPGRYFSWSDTQIEAHAREVARRLGAVLRPR